MGRNTYSLVAIAAALFAVSCDSDDDSGRSSFSRACKAICELSDR